MSIGKMEFNGPKLKTDRINQRPEEQGLVNVKEA